MFGNDADKALEKTAYGYHLNQKALAQLQEQQKQSTKTDYLGSLADQQEALRKVEESISKGLLAGLYEFPNLDGHLSMDEVTEYSKNIGLMPVRVQKLPEAKHIFSHIEWHMTGYEVIVDELEKTNEKGFLFIHPEEIRKEYSIPSAFEKYTGYAGIERE